MSGLRNNVAAVFAATQMGPTLAALAIFVATGGRPVPGASPPSPKCELPARSPAELHALHQKFLDSASWVNDRGNALFESFPVEIPARPLDQAALTQQAERLSAILHSMGSQSRFPYTLREAAAPRSRQFDEAFGCKG